MPRNPLLGKNAVESYRRVQLDKAASFWLKQAMQDLSCRDPVDVMHDVQCLLAFARDMCMDAGIASAESMCRQDESPALHLVRKILDGKDVSMLEQLAASSSVHHPLVHELVHQVLYLDARVRKLEGKE